MKYIFKIFKKFIYSAFTLFFFNVMIIPLNVNIGINIITILFISFFGLISLPFFLILSLYFI